MPITIKSASMNYRDPTSGDYVGVNAVSDTTTDIIAPAYADLTFPVAAGQHCIYQGEYYEANAAIQTSESWTAAHWTKLTVADEVTSIKSAIQAKYTKPQTGIPASDLASGVIPDVSGFYTKPVGGIPSTDLADTYIEEPASEGTSGQVLTTDGNGGRSWTTVQSGGGSAGFELIASGTFSSDAERLYINADSNGNPFALEEFILGVFNKASTSNTGEGYGKVVLNSAANAGVNGDGRVVNAPGFFRNSGSQSTIFLNVLLKKCGSKYQFMTTFLTKNDSSNLGTDTNLVSVDVSPRGMTETGVAKTSIIENGITSILVGTDSGKLFGVDSKYILFGRRITA